MAKIIGIKNLIFALSNPMNAIATKRKFGI